MKELKDKLWKERVIFSSKGDPIIFRMHFDSAIDEAVRAERFRMLEVLNKLKKDSKDHWNEFNLLEKSTNDIGQQNFFRAEKELTEGIINGIDSAIERIEVLD